MNTQNEPAFPGGDWDPATTQASTPEKRKSGLTKLEYFVGQALQGLACAPNGPAGDWRQLAEHAVLAAEALLAELDRRQT